MGVFENITGSFEEGGGCSFVSGRHGFTVVLAHELIVYGSNLEYNYHIFQII